MVEIYQGFESSYEHAGAPRSWKAGEAQVHQGDRPAGYVWNAWAKGYKLGVQSSSDHISTHSSYACILVEHFTRQGLVDAMRKRHTYAATDTIVMDFRVSTAEGTFLMGDIFDSKSQPKLVVNVLGTAPIKQIDVIKNNQYIYKVNPAQKTAHFEYVDYRHRSRRELLLRARRTDRRPAGLVLADLGPRTVKRREFIRTAGLFATAPIAVLNAQSDAARKPNIIFILADELGIGNVGCYGADNFKTPNIDGLARDGTRYTHCYTAPLCGPSCALILTGRYAIPHRCDQPGCCQANGPSVETMMPGYLKPAGYVTASVGKWGQLPLGPAEFGFDEASQWDGKGYLPDAMHDFLVDFITRHRDDPFYVYYSMSNLQKPKVWLRRIVSRTAPIFTPTTSPTWISWSASLSRGSNA